MSTPTKLWTTDAAELASMDVSRSLLHLEPVSCTIKSITCFVLSLNWQLTGNHKENRSVLNENQIPFSDVRELPNTILRNSR